MNIVVSMNDNIFLQGRVSTSLSPQEKERFINLKGIRMLKEPL